MPTLSVFNRKKLNKDTVESNLESNGWTKTASIMNGKIDYYSNSGINMTVVQGPFATLTFPSGPIRGNLFGSNSTSNFGNLSSYSQTSGGHGSQTTGTAAEQKEQQSNSGAQTTSFNNTREVATFQ